MKHELCKLTAEIHVVFVCGICCFVNGVLYGTALALQLAGLPGYRGVDVTTRSTAAHPLAMPKPSLAGHEPHFHRPFGPPPAAAVNGWLDSDGHCANIMNANFEELGVGYYPGGMYGHYWTQKFGSQ